MMQFITKLGKTRAGERTRIWIEGARLTEAGFQVGDYFAKTWGDHSLTLAKSRANEITSKRSANHGKVSGKGNHPIIDITGAKVAETFDGSHVLVSYAAGQITIANNISA